ncbi:hypothetical protein C8Q80DRAFT_1118604 [Daedaleopsis nitida]|nr:hypothetical protein C8Q80DRAFT_1118604 [Daedaleopsis nitida]
MSYLSLVHSECQQLREDDKGLEEKKTSKPEAPIRSLSVLATFNIRVQIVLFDLWTHSLNHAAHTGNSLSSGQLPSVIVSRFIVNLRAVQKNSSTVSTVSHTQSAPEDSRLSGFAASFSGLMYEEVVVPEESMDEPAEAGDVPS